VDAEQFSRVRSAAVRTVALTRYLLLLAVVGLFVGAALLLILGGVGTVRTVIEAIPELNEGRHFGKTLMVGYIELADLFLVGTILYITALGIYTLFIDNTLPLPAWLVIRTIGDLKNKLISVVIVVLGVNFLAQAITVSNERDLLAYGAAIAVVIISLTGFLYVSSRNDH
jgi:uncharacterized membrane protein YqhA